MDEKYFNFFDLPLDSVHASMVLYTQEVREKQNKENKKHNAKTPEGRAKDPEETTAERGASLGEKQKKEGGQKDETRLQP